MLSLFPTFIAGCLGGAKEEQASNQGPSEEEVVVPSASPQGAAYSFSVNGAEITLYHDDVNQNGIFESHAEKLTLQVGDAFCTYGEEKYKQFHERFHLPDFNQLSIARWHSAHQALFLQPASSDDESALESLREFCLHHKVNFYEAVSLSLKIKTQTKGDRLNALAIVSLLMSIQKQGDGDFYSAKNVAGEMENKWFIDEVLAKISEGKLGVYSAALEQMGFTLVQFEYRPSNNAIKIDTNLTIDVTQPSTTFSLLHELYHFFQDLRKMHLSVQDLEKSAYVKGAEYALYEAGLTTESALDDYISHIYNRKGFSFDLQIAALNLAYYNRKGDAPKVKEWSEELDRLLSVQYILEPLLKPKRDALDNLVFKDAAACYLADTCTRKIQEAIEDRDTAYKQFVKFLESDNGREVNKTTMESIILQALGSWYYLIDLKWVVGRYKENLIRDEKESRLRTRDESVTITGIDRKHPDFIEMMTTLAAHKPAANYLWIFSGVE